jgi:RHS repeat-associated protein
VDGAAITHDSAGARLSEQRSSDSLSYTYDDFGRLIRVGSRLTGETEFKLDGQGRRVQELRNGAVIRGFLYGTSIMPVAELTASGAVSTEYVYAFDGTAPEYLIQGSKTIYLLKDQLGSVLMAIDAGSGAIAQEIDYDTDPQVPRNSNPTLHPFGYGGGLTDIDGRFVHFGARDYDARTGRWLEPDPIGVAGGANRFAYSENDPINKTDPSGLATCTYSITKRVLVCKPSSGGAPVSLGPVGVWSGVGRCANNVSCIKVPDIGPIVPGNYKMNRDDRPGHDMFWRLEPDPKIPGWKCRLGLERCGFELHPGGTSLGCITADKKNPDTMDDYRKVDDLLKRENGKNKLMVTQ